MSVTGFLVNNEVQKYDYESLDNYNTPNFNISSTYQVGDYVMYQGKLYKCITEITSSGAWDSSKWESAILSDDVANITRSVEPIALINLINPSKIISGKFVQATTGNILDDTSVPPAASITDYIDISTCTEIVYSRRGVLLPSPKGGIAFYDNNKSFISGVIDVGKQDERKYIINKVSVPEGTKYVVMTLFADNISGAFLYDGANYNSQYLVIKNKDIITTDNIYPVSNSDIVRKYIDTSGIIASTFPSNPRLLVIPVGGIFGLNVKIGIQSTKRYGFCNSLDGDSPVFGYTEVVGELDVSVQNFGYKYFIVQLFINSDTEKTIETYLRNMTISFSGNTDAFARMEIFNATKGKFYHAECLQSLPILESFSDITIDTDSFDNCAAYHALMGELCSNSNGFITQTLLGNDGHGNNLYKYVTHPKTLKYGVDRSEFSPTYPITGGRESHPITVLLTADIHGREKNGNWVIYNLFSKMLAPDTEMLRFFRNRVRLVCVPYICASGTYNNADGININRDFPTSFDGTCVSAEATLVKSVIDEYGKDIFLHLDIHTYNAGSAQDNDVAGWIFTDNRELGERCVVTAESVLTRYVEKYPNIARLGYDYIGSTNIPTTCTYYSQTVYGTPSATVEAVLTMDGSPSGSDSHTSATAYFYDIITQTICSMVN